MSTNAKALADLRAALDFYEHSEVLQENDRLYVGNNGIIIFATTPEEFAAKTRALHGTIDNPVVKDASETTMSSTRKFGTAYISVNIYRTTVCERVEVGTKQVEKPIMVQTGTELVDEPIFEWKCTDAVLATHAPALTVLDVNGDVVDYDTAF